MASWLGNLDMKCTQSSSDASYLARYIVKKKWLKQSFKGQLALGKKIPWSYFIQNFFASHIEGHVTDTNANTMRSA